MRPTNFGRTSKPKSNAFMAAISRQAAAVTAYTPAFARSDLGTAGFSSNPITHPDFVKFGNAAGFGIRSMKQQHREVITVTAMEGHEVLQIKVRKIVRID
jgi:hypothetical protein